MLLKLALTALLLLTVAPAAVANDAAASTAMGGIQLKREARIAMEKERLSISPGRVRIDYEFLNETDQDITTEIAFPIPAYTFDYHDFGDRGFNDFRLWVDGKELRYGVELKAMHRGADCTALLRKHNVDAASFGHFDQKRMVARDFQRLSTAGRAELAAAGLITTEDNFPNWTVYKTYYWTQTFPARKVVHVRHEYSPVIGYSQISVDDLDHAAAAKNQPDKEPYGELESYNDEPDVTVRWTYPDQVLHHACVTADLAKRVRAAAEPKMRAARTKDDFHISWVHWIDYILATANTWKTPIKHFELIVDIPKARYVTFCWDGPVERRDATHLAVRATDFVPKDELHVAYIEP